MGRALNLCRGDNCILGLSSPKPPGGSCEQPVVNCSSRAICSSVNPAITVQNQSNTCTHPPVSTALWHGSHVVSITLRRRSCGQYYSDTGHVVNTYSVTNGHVVSIYSWSALLSDMGHVVSINSHTGHVISLTFWYRSCSQYKFSHTSCGQYYSLTQVTQYKFSHRSGGQYQLSHTPCSQYLISDTGHKVSIKSHTSHVVPTISDKSCG